MFAKRHVELWTEKSNDNSYHLGCSWLPPRGDGGCGQPSPFLLLAGLDLPFTSCWLPSPAGSCGSVHPAARSEAGGSAALEARGYNTAVFQGNGKCPARRCLRERQSRKQLHSVPFYKWRGSVGFLKIFLIYPPLFWVVSVHQVFSSEIFAGCPAQCQTVVPPRRDAEPFSLTGFEISSCYLTTTSCKELDISCPGKD